MMQKIRGWFRRLFAAGGDKKYRLPVVLGLVGILIIALSEWLPSADAPSQETAAVSAAAVERALEDRITSLISRVRGVGECSVMVTLESGSRYVYAAEQSYTGGKDAYTGSEKTLLVETDTGPVGLLVTEIQPTVKGVAVVCVGGDNAAVREQVSGLICAALNISSGRVCVARQQ